MHEVYSMSNRIRNSNPYYSLEHSSNMQPRQLLEALMNRDGDNPSSLARKLHNEVRQPQIHKFLRGAAREPRRATLAPIAKHYGIPLEAFYSTELAEQTAARLGLLKSDDTAPVAEAGEAAPPQRPIPIPITKRVRIEWPFDVSHARMRALPPEAWRDINAHIELLVEKWERLGAGEKRLLGN